MRSVTIKAVVLCLTIASTPLAMAKSGEVGIIQCGGGQVRSIASSPQHSFTTYEAYTTVRANPSGGLFDMMSGQCLGAGRLVDSKPSVWGHCEWTDRDGDKVLLHFVRSEGLLGKFTVVHGTGKYSGIRGTRDYQVTPFPAILGGRAVCDEGKLRYTLPD
jgi:hypothetical protein